MSYMLFCVIGIVAVTLVAVVALNTVFGKPDPKHISPATPCPHCGNMSQENAVYCDRCGYTISGEEICRHCFTELEPDATFCPKCGLRRYTDEDFSEHVDV